MIKCLLMARFKNTKSSGYGKEPPRSKMFQPIINKSARPRSLKNKIVKSMHEKVPMFYSSFFFCSLAAQIRIEKQDMYD